MQNRFTVDLVQLRTLRELREHGTITATAAALHLTPSAVSQQIASLSRSVGAPLLTRHGRRVRLTPQADIVLDHADCLYTELEAIKAEFAGFGHGQAGAVQLAAFGTAITGLVVPALPLLAAEHPGLSVSVAEVEPPECFRRLDAGEADVAISVDYQDGPSSRDPRYERTALCRDPLFTLVPALALGDSHPGVAAIPVGPQTPARSIYAAVRNGSATAPHIAAVLAALRAAASRAGEG
jgi:DNA-binding transcriptional LysR family regulator